MYYVYVLRCTDGVFYTGYTHDLKARLKHHRAGQVFSTKCRLPVDLVFYEAFCNRMDAKRRESYLKKSAGKKALKLMIRDFLKSQKSPERSS